MSFASSRTASPEEELRHLKETIALLKEELRGEKQENAYQRWETERINGQIEALNADINWRRGLYNDLVGDIETIKKKNEDLKILADSLKSELAYQKAENERLTTELEGANSNLERYIEHHITSQKNMSDHFSADLTALRQENMRLKNQLAGIQH